ncbi:MAG: hypothetical protein EBZ47_00840 [Chlamydiae bacterium]|nr:hypothetical protein [Chlamydiota bacterium]
MTAVPPSSSTDTLGFIANWLESSNGVKDSLKLVRLSHEWTALLNPGHEQHSAGYNLCKKMITVLDLASFQSDSLKFISNLARGSESFKSPGFARELLDYTTSVAGATLDLEDLECIQLGSLSEKLSQFSICSSLVTDSLDLHTELSCFYHRSEQLNSTITAEEKSKLTNRIILSGFEVVKKICSWIKSITEAVACFLKITIISPLISAILTTVSLAAKIIKHFYYNFFVLNRNL